MLKRKLIAVVILAIFVCAIAIFTLYQAETHPLSVGVASSTSYGSYLVQGVQVHQIHIEAGGSNLTLYVQLITPRGNLSNSVQFLFEVNIVVVSTSKVSKSVAATLLLNSFSMDNSSLPATKVNQWIQQGKVFQSVYSSISVRQPITYFTDFGASVTVNFYSTLGPFYVKQQSRTIAL